MNFEIDPVMERLAALRTGDPALFAKVDQDARLALAYYLDDKAANGS
ncbi:hypothetical protein ABZ478_32120 [Streptomyces sp. NPDC005706]